MRKQTVTFAVFFSLCALTPLVVLSDGIEQLQKRAESGNAAAQLEIGWMYQHGYYVPQSDSEAFKWYHKAALQELASAQSNLGLMYMVGRGVQRNTSKALNWFMQASRKGHSLAQYNLGLAYANGDGVNQDYKIALDWFLKAAENVKPEQQSEAEGIYQVSDSLPWATHSRYDQVDQGRLAAQNQLGFMYQTALGVEQDYTQALKWYRKAAERDYQIAQRNLANMYQNGYGVAQDLSESLKWFRRAAENGDTQAQNHLGTIYTMGTGVTKDFVQACLWFNLSAAAGDDFGIKGRDFLMQNMSPEQISECQQLALESIEKMRNGLAQN